MPSMEPYNNMYASQQQEYPLNRSPSSTRGYNGHQHQSLNRQTSRQFPQYETGMQGMYAAEMLPQQRYETPELSRYDSRMQPPPAPSNYGYDHQTWAGGYGGPAQNGNAMGGGTGRIKTPSRRPAIPSVSHPCGHISMPLY